MAGLCIAICPEKGFKSVRLLVERETGKLMTIGLWETEADFQATVEWNKGQIAQFAELFAATAPPVVGRMRLQPKGEMLKRKSNYLG